MSAPQGYVALDLVGFTDKGDYAAGSAYVKNDLVHSDNKIYLSLQDNNTGQALPVSPETETAFWKLWLSGGADSLELITAKDTGNLTGGGAGTVVVAQDLIDAIVEKYTELNSDLETVSDDLKNILAAQNVIEDCNAVNTTSIGTYRSESQNIPQAGSRGMLFTYIGENGTWAFQVAISTENNIFQRSNINNAGWYDWREISPEWTYLGGVGFGQNISLPASCKELYVESLVSGCIFTVSVPKLALSESEKTFILGADFSNSNNVYGIDIKATSTYVRLANAMKGGVQQSDSQLFVYYR